MINPGSVGQPRDGDWRAAFALFDSETQVVHFHRAPYNLKAAPGPHLLRQRCRPPRHPPRRWTMTLPPERSCHPEPSGCHPERSPAPPRHREKFPPSFARMFFRKCCLKFPTRSSFPALVILSEAKDPCNSRATSAAANSATAPRLVRQTRCKLNHALASPRRNDLPLRHPPREHSRPLPHRPQRRRRARQSRPGRLRRGVQDQSGQKVAALSEYLGHQTNNFAEYQGLIAALEYALQHGPKALKLISDSELLVRQIKGIYKVKNPTLRDLHARAKELIAQLDWFSIGHALREHNQDADRLANEAMDKGMGRVAADRVARTLLPANPAPGKDHVAAAASAARSSSQPQPPEEFEGIIRNGVVELGGGKLPEGTRVQVRVKK